MRVESIIEVLPGANCGGCGFPGCGGLANAIVEGKAAVNACPVGGEICAIKIGDIMGVSSESEEKQVAKVLCKGNCKSAKDKYKYEGIQDCRSASMLNSGPKDCRFGCLGFGTCKEYCKFDAISVAKDKYKYEGIQDCRSASMLNSGPKDCRFGCLGFGTCKEYCKFDAISVIDGLAIIDEEKCVMCGKCIEVCPKSIIHIKPANKEVVVECSSEDFGKAVREKCSVGCIGCGLGKCIEVCPKSIIHIKPANKEVVVECSSEDFGKAVREKCSVGCIGCGLCKKACLFGAIEFENKIAKINYVKCVECMECVRKCPTKVIKGDISKIKR